MADYISREAVIRLIETEGYNEKYDLGHPKDNDWFCEEVNRIPAADVAEVRHGEWKKIDVQPYFRKHYSIGNYSCSVCHRKGMRDWNYCPNCGAKMDGGGDNV